MGVNFAAPNVTAHPSVISLAVTILVYYDYLLQAFLWPQMGEIVIAAGGRGGISWEFIHGLLELAIYGGRVDNAFDSRVLMSYLKQFFNSEVISEQNRGSKKLGPMTIPNSTQYRVR